MFDAVLAQDRNGHVACETLVTTGLVAVAGEVTTTAEINIPDVVRQTIRRIGYDNGDVGFDGNTCGVIVALDEQSTDIRQGLEHSADARGGEQDKYAAQGAGDQGMMFGYACDETPDLMPMPIWLAHRLSRGLSVARKTGVLDYLRPDGKTQVSFAYEGGRPVRLDTVVVSTHHARGVDYPSQLIPDIKNAVVLPNLPAEFADDEFTLHVNPTGTFVVGGPVADAGLTGRKIIVDTYGGMARHGGGAFSGKDPSKVDRSAAYAARWVAKHVVAAGAASRCEVQVAYAIGVARPVSLMVNTFGTERVDPEKIEGVIREMFDLRPAAIIAELDLLRPIYQQTAAYGHFGRSDIAVPWEQTSRLPELRAALGLS